MKLKKTFVTHNSGGEMILVDASAHFSGLVRGNKTAAFIVECLKEDTTQDEIIDKLMEKYDVSRDVLEKDVATIIGQLNSINALE